MSCKDVLGECECQMMLEDAVPLLPLLEILLLPFHKETYARQKVIGLEFEHMVAALKAEENTEAQQQSVHQTLTQYRTPRALLTHLELPWIDGAPAALLWARREIEKVGNFDSGLAFASEAHRMVVQRSPRLPTCEDIRSATTADLLRGTHDLLGRFPDLLELLPTEELLWAVPWASDVQRAACEATAKAVCFAARRNRWAAGCAASAARET